MSKLRKLLSGSLTLFLAACSANAAESGNANLKNDTVVKTNDAADTSKKSYESNAKDIERAINSGDQVALTKSMEKNINMISADMDMYDKQYKAEAKEIQSAKEIANFGQPTTKFGSDDQ